MMPVDVNRPDVVAEVQALSAAYDRALLDNDVDALVDFFWADAQAMRMGVTEELYGSDDISAFRKARVVNFNDRKTIRETITTFGDSFAIAAVEFSVSVEGAPRHGRQTQIWVKFPALGWRIVSAHVSHRVTPATGSAFGEGKTAAYAAAAAAFLEMPIDPAFAPGVTRDLSIMAEILSPLMKLDLSSIEPAPKFVA